MSELGTTYPIIFLHLKFGKKALGPEFGTILYALKIISFNKLWFHFLQLTPKW